MWLSGQEERIIEYGSAWYLQALCSCPGTTAMRGKTYRSSGRLRISVFSDLGCVVWSSRLQCLQRQEIVRIIACRHETLGCSILGLTHVLRSMTTTRHPLGKLSTRT